MNIPKNAEVKWTQYKEGVSVELKLVGPGSEIQTFESAEILMERLIKKAATMPGWNADSTKKEDSK